MNWGQFKDPVSHISLCLAGSVVASWSLVQRDGNFEPFYCYDRYFCQWIQWKHLGKTQLGFVYMNRQGRRFIYRLKWVECSLGCFFTHFVKWIKGANDKNDDTDGTRKRVLSSKYVGFMGSTVPSLDVVSLVPSGLCKREKIIVRQREPYADIYIARGQRFDE